MQFINRWAVMLGVAALLGAICMTPALAQGKAKLGSPRLSPRPIFAPRPTRSSRRR